MSKQLYLYALPTDIDRIMSELRETLSVVLISPRSSHPEPTWIDSPLINNSLLESWDSKSIDCCLIPNGLAEIRFEHYKDQALWHVSEDSESISASGCDFDGKILVRGRFYCRTDVLKVGEIVRKSPEFIRWAESVFRLLKRNLQWSRELGTYVAADALAWERQGGRFASLVLPGHKIIYASPEPR